jgi:hypothetical protein
MAFQTGARTLQPPCLHLVPFNYSRECVCLDGGETHLACSSTDSNETTEQQSRAAQPIATIQTNSSQAPQEDQPTKKVNPNTGSKTSSGLPNTANTGRENATIERPSFGTATPEAGDPVATPTQPLRQKQGGAVILAQPTPTITPVPTPTSTPLPPSTPYWKQFSQADYTSSTHPLDRSIG